VRWFKTGEAYWGDGSGLQPLSLVTLPRFAAVGKEGQVRNLRLIGLLLAAIVMFGSVSAGRAMPDRVPTDSQTYQENACEGGDGSYLCPAVAEDSHTSIEYVRLLHDGIEIKLTSEGVELGNGCGGAGELVTMTRELIKRSQGAAWPSPQFDWEGRQLEDEVYAHAYFASLPEDATFMGIDFTARGNPINIVFADYTDRDTRTTGDAIQQLAFRLLGSAQRAVCEATAAGD
jgi:hypothetical protein